MLKLTHRDFEKFKSKGYLETTKDFLEKKYGLKFSKRGRQYFTYCPFHTENIPSFALYDKLEEVRLHCFGNCILSKRDFDVFEFVQIKDKCTLREAYEKVKKFFTQTANCPSPSPANKENSVGKMEKTLSRPTREEIIPILTRAAGIYHEILLTCQDLEVEKARDYLRQRGVDESLIKEFRVGYVPKLGSRVKSLNWYFKDIFAKNYPLCKESGLFTMLSGAKRKVISTS